MIPIDPLFPIRACPSCPSILSARLRIFTDHLPGTELKWNPVTWEFHTSQPTRLTGDVVRVPAGPPVTFTVTVRDDATVGVSVP